MENMEKAGNMVKQGSHQASDGRITEAGGSNGERRTFIPSVDIIDNDSDTMLVLDVPGVACDGVDILIEKNIMTIKATPEEKGQSCDNPIYSECRRRSYQRSFSLSDAVDQENVSASVKDGVLRVKLPKTAPVTKRVNVSVN